jgi:hypothetical protein
MMILAFSGLTNALRKRVYDFSDMKKKFPTYSAFPLPGGTWAGSREEEGA